jgi:ribosomal protein S18 acetylase RimI-like enzyme
VEATGRREAEVVPAASLVLLAVDPDYQRRGIGDRLTDAFLAELRRRGAESVKLAVDTDNTSAVAFYQSRGWRRVGRYATPDGGFIYRMVRSTGDVVERRGSNGWDRVPAGAADRRSRA